MKEYTSRILAASAALNVENQAIIDILTKIGINESTGVPWLNDEDIFTFGDFRQNVSDKPIAQIRAAFAALRGNKSEKVREDMAGKLGIEKTIDTIETEELLWHYDPSKVKSPVAQELKKRLGSDAVIFFRPDNGVAIPETMGLISDYEQGLIRDLPQTLQIDGIDVESVPVGQRNDIVLEEDPMFPGYALRNHRSTVNNRNYKDVPLATRQFIRLVVDASIIDPVRPVEAVALMTMAKDMAELKDSYPVINREFIRLGTLRCLPPLTVMSNSLAGKKSSRIKSPFAIH